MSDARAAAPPLISIEGLAKSFETGDGSIEVLRGLDLEVQAGDRIAIVGQSGVGKSTLLHILGTLDHPTAGHGPLPGRGRVQQELRASWPACATSSSASSSSSTTCCPSSPPRRT